MKHVAKVKWSGCVAAITAAGLAAPSSASACAACFGRSDSLMARSVNWGIFTLLIVVVGVLGAIASFFVYLARRAAAVSGPTESAPAPAPELVEEL